MNNLLSEFKKIFEFDKLPKRYIWYHLPKNNQYVYNISYFLGSEKKEIKIKIKDFEIKKERIWLNSAYENINILDIIYFKKEN